MGWINKTLFIPSGVRKYSDNVKRSYKEADNIWIKTGDEQHRNTEISADLNVVAENDVKYGFYSPVSLHLSVTFGGRNKRKTASLFPLRLAGRLSSSNSIELDLTTN